MNFLNRVHQIKTSPFDNIIEYFLSTVILILLPSSNQEIIQFLSLILIFSVTSRRSQNRIFDGIDVFMVDYDYPQIILL
jgi:hypothetical protein